MEKVLGNVDLDAVLTEFREKAEKDELTYAMLAYVDADNNLVLLGDSHSVAIIVTNIVGSAVHSHLHSAEEKYEARKETGGLPILEGFVPDDSGM